MQPIISIKGVHKSFKDVKALQGVDLDIYPGEFIALLGPNGAGKTTLIETIEGIQMPDSGMVEITGKQWKQGDSDLQKILGIALQETRFTEKLTVFETVKLFASFYRVDDNRVDEVIQLVKLEEKKKAYAENLSGGQRQRMALAIALLNKPRILLLDEPTTGLDPSSRREMWEILRNLKSNDTAMILTTHYMEEAEQLCERIVMMNKGRVLMQGKLTDLLKGHKNLDELFIHLTGEYMNESKVI